MEAAAYLRECRSKTERSAAELRKQLAYAEELRGLLAARGEA